MNGAPLASDRAYEVVKTAILTDEYPPGTFLTEGALATALRVSRTPVREALLRLEADGLVSLHPRKGALVRAPSAENMREMFETRRLIEPFAAQKGWARREELARRLQPLVNDMSRCGTRRTVVDFVSADRAFHGQLVGAAGNSIVAGLYENIRDRQAAATVSALRVAPGRMATATREHADIVDALCGADPNRMVAAVIRHIVNAAAGPGRVPLPG